MFDESVKERFWAKVNKTEGCWEWRAGTDRDGYGRLRVEDRTIRAHRIGWALSNGSLPENCVCHTCDNPSCVRPDHLWVGPPRQNNSDRASKGRNRDQTGPRNSQAKLTPEIVQAILADDRFQKVIGEAYGVSQGAVSMIKNGKRWVDASI